MTNHLQTLHHRRGLRQTRLTRCPRRRDTRTVRGADIPRLGAVMVGGCALIDHFSVAGPGDIWKTSLSTPKVARGWHSGRGRIYALDTTTFVSLSSKLHGTLRFLQPSQGCSPEHLIFCLRQREHLYHVAIVLDERPVLSDGERVENEGLARWMIFLPFFWRWMSP